MSNEIKSIEIFATGTHNGDKYSIDDLKQIVNSFYELDFLPAVKLGHTKEPGAPAFGYVSNLRLVGEKLLADLINLPQEVYKAIKEKRYNRVSSEIYWDLKRNGKNYKRALGALALLGQEIPGVANIKPISKYDIDDENSEKYSCYDFDNVNFEVANGDNLNAGNGLKKGANNMANDAAKEYQDTLDAMQRQFDELKEQADKDRSKLSTYESQIETLKGANNRLSESLADREANEFVNKLSVPALRPSIKALYMLGKESDQKLKVYDADGKSSEKSVIDVVNSIVEYVNTKADVLFKEHAFANHEKSEGFDDPGAEADKRAQEYMEKHKSDDYSAAIRAVLNADQALKEAYNSMS